DEIVSIESVILEKRANDQDVDRHPNRPAPVGVAAEHAAVRFGRQIGDSVNLFANAEDVGMLCVITRERADAVWAEEFIFIQHPGQHTPEFGFVQDRAEPAAFAAEHGWVMDKCLQLRSYVEILFEPVREVRIFFAECIFEYTDSAERQQADHRADLQSLTPAVRQLEHVIKEAILFIPHACIAAGMHRGRSNGEEVLDKLCQHVQIGLVVQRQFPGYLKHIQTEKRHPGGAIGLFEISARGQWRAAVEDADVIQSEESTFEGVFAKTILAIEPPGEIQQKFLKAALEPFNVSLA